MRLCQTLLASEVLMHPCCLHPPVKTEESMGDMLLERGERLSY